MSSLPYMEQRLSEISKGQFQCNLHDTCLSGSRRLSKGDIPVIAYRRIWICCLRTIPLGVIEGIEGIRAKFRMPVFMKDESFCQREIHVVLPRPSYRA